MDVRDFDASVKPTDDFFHYANGGWLKNNPIPPEEAQWGSFYILRVQVEKQLKAILDEFMVSGAATPSDQAPMDDATRKVRDFYLTGMDIEKANRLSVKPLAELFALVDGMKDKGAISAAAGRLHSVGAWVFWSPFVEQDQKNSEMMTLHLYQGGLSLPDRDYYLNDDEKSREIREKFLKYAEQLLQCSGLDAAGSARRAATVMKMETELAKASRTRVELRDVHKQYNKMGPAELAALTPSLGWAGYFAAIGIAAPEYFIVGQPEFFEALNRAIEGFSLDEIKDYLSWHILNALANYLSEDLGRLRFDFYGRTFSGAKEMKTRWRRVLAVVNDLLDEAMGKLYVERHFSVDAKNKVHSLAQDLIAAYRSRVEQADWMEAATKKKALEKLSGFSRKLGYPDKWKDISGLAIESDSYAANYMRAHAFEFARRTAKIGKPVDRDEWLMSPQTVNAYYQPTMNEIVFPAAILQAPFFDLAADDALNFGGIGEVIGHELTHGFDDQGALFNAQGNLENWWTKEDKERFDARAARLAEQFDNYEPLPGLHMNGKLTLGENIADLGGLLIAYDGLQLALKKSSGEKIIEGLTPEQRFFINYAITERGALRDEALRLRVQTDPHSPPLYRVNGPVSNIAEFYDAFGVKKGDGLFREPEDRAKIW